MNVNYSPKQKGSLRDSEKNVRATLPGGFRASFGGAFLLLVAILRQSPVKTNDSITICKKNTYDHVRRILKFSFSFLQSKFLS